jgi:hypothetical protein
VFGPPQIYNPETAVLLPSDRPFPVHSTSPSSFDKTEQFNFSNPHFGDSNFEPETEGSFPFRKMLEMRTAVASFQEGHQMVQRVGLLKFP